MAALSLAFLGGGRLLVGNCADIECFSLEAFLIAYVGCRRWYQEQLWILFFLYGLVEFNFPRRNAVP